MCIKRIKIPERDVRLWELESKKIDKLDNCKAVVFDPLQLPKALISNREGSNSEVCFNSKLLAYSSKAGFINNISMLQLGDNSNIDGATIKIISRGNYPIDCTLNLHGYTVEKAYKALQSLIITSIQNQYRMLLIITGKGKADKQANLPSQAILKGMLPMWLNDRITRPFILYFTYAVPKHGGTGAFYILLKKIREDKL